MVLHLKKHNGALVPVDQLGQDCFEELKFGQTYKAVITKPREGKLHRKFFLILGQIVDMSDLYTGKVKSVAVEELMETIKYKAGHYRITGEMSVKGYGKVPIMKTKSISYKDCDDAAFEAFYRSAVSVIIKGAEELGIDPDCIDF